jgi:hypothetical protein
MISVSPVTGNIYDTVFTLTTSGLSGEYVVNWGDGIIEDVSSTVSHIYSSANIYDVIITDCLSSNTFSLSAFRGLFFEDGLVITYDSLSAFAGCKNTLTLNLSSQTPYTTINLYNSGSSAQPAYTNDSFWSHLNPEWGFYDTEGDNITTIDMTGTPVYSGTNIIGYTAFSDVDFKDDIYGERVLFFTVDKKEKNTKINSRVYAAVPYSVSAIAPTNLLITSDGLIPINTIQWSDHDIPFVTSVVNSDLSCSTITHYACGYLTDVKFVDGCYGLATESYTISTSSINLFDENCFYTGGYLQQVLNIPLSAIEENEIIFETVECGVNPAEASKNTIRRSPYQMTLTASGVFNVAGTVYTLTGQSNPFNVYRFENFHDFYRYGEETNVYDLIKRYNHFDFNELPKFDQYMESIFGPGDTLGKVYDKIQNLNKDHQDLDICNIDSIYDIADKLDADVFNFGLLFPEELKRIMDFTSVPLQKLIGSRVYADGKITELIESNDTISESEVIAYKESGMDTFGYYEVPQTMVLSELSSVSLFSDISQFCFYRWQDSSKKIVVDSLINYDDSRNMLDPSLTNSSDWYNDNGVLDEMYSYILTKNLLNS